VDYNIGIAYRRTDGAFKDILPEPDSYAQTAFNASVGASLGSRATLRSSLRYSDSQGKSMGNIDYGTRDRGTVYENKDLTWHLEQSHLGGSQYTGTATVNYFRQNALSADSIADPTFNVYTLLEGTHLAPFPDGPRLVRLLTQSEFDSLSANPSAWARISSSRRPLRWSPISRFPARPGSASAVRFQVTWRGAAPARERRLRMGA
jgi:hypothetical protein